ncbi:7TM diverse intracellular signaling domain-containing protein [Hugenholtzia roseola]|uniref:7TM diverse intracellular signaling domain-containing protein n=1 Tax=Hugenholtzia roseola TaxID=1002 RepID=UPI0003F5C41E|nr:7TM diverse intracellular signaling domain-containing protein [Hugenholtzia roseola]
MKENKILQNKLLFFHLFFLILFYFLTFSPLLAKEPPILRLLPQQEAYELAPYLYQVSDSEQDYYIHEVSKKNFKPLLFKEIDRNKTVHWLKLILYNPLEESQDFYISIGFIDEVTAYLLLPSGNFQEKKVGSLTPLSEREVKIGSSPFLKFTINAHKTQVIYLKLHSQTELSAQDVRYSLKRWFKGYTDEGFRNQFYRQRSYKNFLYGAMLMMLLYNLIVYVTLREKDHLYYLLYNFFIFLYLFSNSGYILEFILYNYPRIDLGIWLISGAGTLFCFLLFGKHYLQTQIFVPLWHQIIKALQGISLLIALLFILRFWNIGMILNMIALPISLLTILIAAIVCYMRGYKIAKYFIIANFIFVISFTLYSLEVLALIKNVKYLDILVLIGITIKLAIFSYSLAERVRNSRLALLKQEKEKQILVERQNQELEQKVEERTLALQQSNQALLQQQQQIEQQKDEISYQKSTLQNQYRQITDSLRYAETIQQAILPTSEKMREILHDFFLIYRPKDIVSGDFYWCQQVQTAPKSIFPRRSPIEFSPKEIEKKLIAVADCTGHGVPGAFMSMIGATLLNEIVNLEHIYEPHHILETLHLRVQIALKQSERANADGMDLTFCTIEAKENDLFLVEFTGAKRNLFWVHYPTGEIGKLAGDKKSIGGMQKKDKAFTKQEILVKKETILYLFTDGFADQANEKGQKFGTLALEHLLAQQAHLPLAEQKEKIENALIAHQGETQQRDDITLMAIKVGH